MSWIGKDRIHTVPIILGFDSAQIVGSVTIDLSKVPQNTNWCLSLETRSYGRKETLVCFGLVPDVEYAAYLNNQVDIEGI